MPEVAKCASIAHSLCSLCTAVDFLYSELLFPLRERAKAFALASCHYGSGCAHGVSRKKTIARPPHAHTLKSEEMYLAVAPEEDILGRNIAVHNFVLVEMS